MLNSYGNENGNQQVYLAKKKNNNNNFARAAPFLHVKLPSCTF